MSGVKLTASGGKLTTSGDKLTMSGVKQGMRKLLAIVGPTATGKSELAIALARRYDGEVVGADSRQVYRGMDIGTAKPTPRQRALAPHHLLDVADPDQPFGLAQFQELAGAALEAIWARGRLPILAGGSGQYVWAVLEGWNVPRVPPDHELRGELEERARREGAAAMWRELAALDPAAAAKIHPQNVRRVVRALEVYRRLGRPISACQTKSPPQCDTLIIGLACRREELYRRIDRRVEAMVEAGLVEEVRDLLAGGYRPELPAMSGIGYKEVRQHLAGALTLAEAVEHMKVETHRLARHQQAWFKPADPRIRWLPAGPEAVEEASRLVEAELGLKAVEADGSVTLSPSLTLRINSAKGLKK